jgi:predicted AAA+ superfamily ATPase
MIDRKTDIGLVRVALRRSRVVALLGPRQCGKTTLARQFVAVDSINYFDLEDPQNLARLDEPSTALRPLRGLVVIDEVQRRPELFPLLRALADRKPSPARFLILGSASPDLLRQSSESLAGRLETVHLEGLRLQDVGVFMLRQLQPWFENIAKRQVKSPKVFVRDSGLLHALLGIATRRDLEHHPKVGASWEGFAIEEALKAIRPDEAYYWATQQGAELDLLLFKRGRRIGLECKRMDAPTMTPSMRIALDDLKLDRLIVVYPGDRRYALADSVEVVPLADLVAGGAGG